MMFVMVAHWNRRRGADRRRSQRPDGVFRRRADAGGRVGGVMLLPATLGALIAEAFAIRSWMYHAVNGGLSAAVSLVTIGALDKTTICPTSR